MPRQNGPALNLLTKQFFDDTLILMNFIWSDIMKILYKLERKFGKYAIKNLMNYIIFANVVVLILSLYDSSFISNLVFDPYKVMQGEIWRIITFIFIPPNASLIFIFFALYVNYFIGISLEKEWGTFRFNCYYFLGVIGIIIGALISGLSMGNYYLNLSLFLAFAKLYPEHEFVLFFILPVKVKYLGWINWAFFILGLITGGAAMRIAISIAIVNYFIFFGKDIITCRGRIAKSHVRKKSFQNKMDLNKSSLHRCEVCNRTENDDNDLEFRYCSKCNGEHEYCLEHLFNHEHKE